METQTLITVYVVLPVAGYLLGAIPFGLLIGKARGVDIRQQGSGNIGSTNVGRILGRPWGYICFVLDVAKGFVPVWWAGRYLSRLMETAGEETVSMGVQVACGWVWWRGRGLDRAQPCHIRPIMYNIGGLSPCHQSFSTTTEETNTGPGRPGPERQWIAQ